MSRPLTKPKELIAAGPGRSHAEAQGADRAAAAAVATLAALSPAAAGAASHAPAASGTQLWVSRYNGPGNFVDNATSVAVSGTRVFVTGYSAGRKSGYDYATVAYRAATGKKLWVQRYNGPANRGDSARAMAVNAAGTAVFVTGSSYGRKTGDDYATVAYSAATGKKLWASRYNGPANSTDGASSVAVNPRGTVVFVTGTSTRRTSRGYPNKDYATVAYSAATGRQLWVQLYNGLGNSSDEASSVAVSPRGTVVFVTGSSFNHRTGHDYATIAYSAATGKKLWVRGYSGPGNGWDAASWVAVNRTTVFVTGYSPGQGTATDYATVAYRAATGRQLWVQRYNGPANSTDEASSVAVSPRGTVVFVTGFSVGGQATGADYATVAYSAATGRQLWVQRYNGPANNADVASSVAVSPRGTAVYVTGSSIGQRITYDYATLAYSAATGKQLWLRRYNGPGNGWDSATSVAVNRTTVFVTGYSSFGRGTEYGTIAYRG